MKSQMSVKTVVCAVCGETVSKKKTLAIGNNQRACRTHESTNQKAQTQQKQRKDKEQLARSKWKNRRTVEPPKIDLKPKCLNCGVHGVHQTEFFMSLLLAGEKYQLIYGKALNPLDPVECQKAYANLKGPCLWVVEYDPQKMKFSFDKRPIAEFFGYLCLCPSCCDQFNIDPLPVRSDLTEDQMSTLGVIYETLLKPSFRDIATKELGERN